MNHERGENRPEQLRRIFWVALGGVILCYGGALAAVSAFREHLIFVATGFVLFVYGYRVSQFGVHGDRLRRALVPTVRDAPRLLTVGIGILVGSYGGTIGAQAIIDPEPFAMLVSGVLMVAGYIITHIAINEAIL